MISKEKLGEFSSITIFNDEYLLVERNGLFNLIDNNGDYVSKTWYKEITKNDGGGADFVEVKTKQKVQLRSIPSIRTYHSIRTALNNTAILSRIDTRCIAVASPFKMFSTTSRKYVTIIAKVTILNKELLLGKNGKLYTQGECDSVEEYHLPDFFISLTDINRLTEVADNFNSVYNSEYDVRGKREKSRVNDIAELHVSCWIFGFDSTSTMVFNTSTSPTIREAETKAWGGNTIKVRFDANNIPELYREKFVEELTKGLLFDEWDSSKGDYNWYTKEYDVNELEDLFSDIKILSNKLAYRKC